MTDNPFHEEAVPNIQSKPSLVQLEAVSSCLITCYFREETDPHLATSSFQGVVKSEEVPLESPFLQAEAPPAPSAAPHQTCAPDPSSALLPFTGHIPAPECLSCPGFQVRSHQCPTQRDDPFPKPPINTSGRILEKERKEEKCHTNKNLSNGSCEKFN
ncbi:hypothetical protein WISP_98814 [Willisornis vidua]|uniref:Uncharacterized protein n=1 Tax=Willisornis vidua TaxID=1566151 RepID=A0ABQ9D536_9PASS|nr:hypothetical protein WISP_98814 [Willisornis vidua]